MLLNAFITHSLMSESITVRWWCHCSDVTTSVTSSSCVPSQTLSLLHFGFGLTGKCPVCPVCVCEPGRHQEEHHWLFVFSPWSLCLILIWIFQEFLLGNMTESFHVFPLRDRDWCCTLWGWNQSSICLQISTNQIHLLLLNQSVHVELFLWKHLYPSAGSCKCSRFFDFSASISIVLLSIRFSDISLSPAFVIVINIHGSPPPPLFMLSYISYPSIKALKVASQWKSTVQQLWVICTETIDVIDVMCCSTVEKLLSVPVLTAVIMDLL